MLDCAALIVLAVTAISLWMNTPFPLEADAIDRALQSDAQVHVTQDDYLVLRP